MTKSDLRTGMRVTRRDGIVCVVMLNAYCTDKELKDVYVSLEDEGCVPLSCHREDLTSRYFDSSDIIKVQVPSCFGAMLNPDAELKTIWERDERKEMTLKEIEELLGYPIKIKEDKHENN